MSSDRLLGTAAALVAVAIALEARTFRVGFYTDSLGARGLPLIAASLIGLGGLLLGLKPKQSIEPLSSTTIIRGIAVTISLLVYAGILPVLGFLLSTIAIVTALSVTFGGPIRRGVLLAGVYTVMLYVLFSYILGLPLPIGRVFVVGS